jgi:hypothetical protein
MWQSNVKVALDHVVAKATHQQLAAKRCFPAQQGVTTTMTWHAIEVRANRISITRNKD